MEHTQHVQVIIFQSTHALWRWEPSASTSVPSFGQPKNSVLRILDPSLQFFFFFFVIRITYQCLRKDLAKIEHGKYLYASMASSTMTERSNANTLVFSHHFIYYHITAKLVKGVWISIRNDLEVILMGI